MHKCITVIWVTVIFVPPPALVYVTYAYIERLIGWAASDQAAFNDVENVAFAFS